ncbi:OPT oligopeptide transporter protein-domain-containing protein [Lasiosphaeria miniovina]|uniref:OPT oligopeptide transporter protein-domain-containing protein n=1 Tax=Lasiosphaeria miniovina TaxID=1954250 RepID=A0AA40DK82_9PEZI|nr:OPT oligopeptide transporter protein-domain-containing protein [Lasiosphaeria miniovina]KAK0706714.1 OPT oligopeptide transporter protein-domain-containing protein [Lasiosphaeria miniovina]
MDDSSSSGGVRHRVRVRDDDTDSLPTRKYGDGDSDSDPSFTWRGVGVGLLVGLVICFSNMYFGLQTGWVSTMTMPASLMGFGIFKLLGRRGRLLDGGPFTPVENVLVQTVAGSMAIMPLGCGFVGVLPAMSYLLRDDEQGPIVLSLPKLILWSLGLCYFGVVFAVPLRRQVLIREKLKFPSGFSTAVLISVLHGRTPNDSAQPDAAGFGSLAGPGPSPKTKSVPSTPLLLGPPDSSHKPTAGGGDADEEAADAQETAASWRQNVQLLLVCFLVSGLSTFATYFFPVLRSVPVFGRAAAATWLWTLNPSLAYVGQGIIMGPATTLHMLLGAVLGWAVLSPLAKVRGWAPGEVDDWEHGSKGWIVWTSLAIMLADAVVSLSYLAVRSVRPYLAVPVKLKALVPSLTPGRRRGVGAGYTRIDAQDADPNADADVDTDDADAEEEDDAPVDQQISDRVVGVGLVLSVAFCIACIHVVFGDLVPLYATVTAVLMALVLSIMGVRALGETDLNPVSGISKLAQLFFALIIPQSHKSSVLINLVAGAVVCVPLIFRSRVCCWDLIADFLFVCGIV